MKRIFSVLFMVSFFLAGILFVSTSGQASSPDYYTEGYYKYTMDSDSITIISYYGAESDIVIPDHIAALPVTRIESSTFAGNKTVKNVTIPETVTRIDDDLFSGMDQLKKVIVQSKSITVKVPERCVVVEDYPVYVDVDKPDTDDKGSSGNDGNNTGVNDVTEGTDNKAENKGNAAEDAENKTESENIEVAGDNLEEIINNETKNPANLQDRPGIRTVNNKLITVDDTGNLVETDDESNVRVIDREHKYTVKENEDGEVIITDENDNKVTLEEDGKVKLGTDVIEEAMGNESEAASEDNSDVVGVENQIVVACIIIVLLAGLGLVIWRKKR